MIDIIIAAGLTAMYAVIILTLFDIKDTVHRIEKKLEDKTE